MPLTPNYQLKALDVLGSSRVKAFPKTFDLVYVTCIWFSVENTHF